jgi:hypothetical protein
MNTKLTLNLLVSGLALTGLTLFITLGHKSPKHVTVKGGGGEEIEGYYQWEQKRLADPATGKIPNNVRYLELKYAEELPSDAFRKNDLRSSRTGSLALNTASWQSRGPWNVGGRTRAFAADVNSEAILVAGSCEGGMWRSADSGKTWTSTTPLALQQSVSCLTQDIRAGHSNIWYYGSGEPIGASASATGAYFVGNGMYRSEDDGQTWTSLKQTATNSFIYSSLWQQIYNVASNPAAPDSLSVVYAATVGAINYSSDTGNTWKLLLGRSSAPYSQYTDVRVSPTGIVYATLSSSGFNGLGNWSDSIGGQMGIWRSADGIHFTNITPPNFPHEYNRMVIGISPLDENQVYFLVNTVNSGTSDTNIFGEVEWDGLWKYKYLSGNGDSAGGAWWDLSANLPHTGVPDNHYNSQGSYDMAVEFLPNDTSTVFIGGTNIYRSTTGFFDTAHTAQIGGYAIGTHYPHYMVYPGHHPDQHVFFFSASNPYIMYNSNDGGIFKTLNDTEGSVSWNTFDVGYLTTMFYTVNSNHGVSGSQVFVGGLQDNDCLFGNAPSSTSLWTKPFFGDGSFNAIADSGKFFYFSTTGIIDEYVKLFKATMDTTTGTVTAFNRMDPIGGTGYEWLNPFVIDPNNNNLMYFGGGKYLWRNNNLAGIPLSGGWDSISTNWVKFPDSIPVTSDDITAIGVSTYPANTVYIGTSNKEVYRIDSANTGFPKFKDITSLLKFPSGAYVTCIAVDPDSANKLLVQYCNYGVYNLFYSTDGGTTFTTVSGNLFNSRNDALSPSMRWVSFQHLPTGGTIYWVATSTGLYATDTLIGAKTEWVQQGAGTIGNIVCDMVDVRPSDGLVSVATHGHGVYAAYITSLSDITTSRDINNPVANQSFSVYPNPSNGFFRISFNLENETQVGLSLYDISGNRLWSNNAQMMSSGNHTLDINENNLQAGLYFLSMKQGGDTKTERVLIVK